MKIVLILSNSTSDAIELTGQSSVMSFDGEHAEVRITLDPSEYDKLGARPSLVDDHAKGPDTPEQPVPPVEDPDQEYIYRITEQGKGASDFTIESYTGMGWTLDDLVKEGHVEKIPVESTVEKSAPPPAPAAPEPAPKPAPPPVPEPEPVFKMTALASGSTKQAFLDQGWTEGQMVVEGFAEWIVPEGLVASTVYTGPWPQDLGGDRWINQHGEEFDADQHARTRNTPPKVKVDGHWKAKVGAGKAKTPIKVVSTPAAKEEAPAPVAIVGTSAAPLTPQAPAAPSADSALNAGSPPPPASINASAAPQAPAAPSVSGVPKAPNAPEVAGATEDADVASILDNWGSTDAPTL